MAHYFIIVPHGRWPSYRALGEALERQGFPVEIRRPARSLSGEPIDTEAATQGLTCLLEGRPLELSACIEREGDYGRDVVEATNADLEAIGAAYRAPPDASHLSIELDDSMDEWIAACYLMATLVREFGAYGYEIDEGTHGDAEWADLLVKGAECRFDYGEDDSDEAPAAAAAMKPGMGIGNWVSIARWVIALAVIGYFTVSSWMKAETALDRQDAVQVAKP